LAGVAGWRLGFLVAGFAGVVWCLAFYPWFRNAPAEMPAVNAAELQVIRSDQATGEETSHGRIDPRMWRALFSSRSLWALAALYFFGSFGWSFFVSWMPDYLSRVHGVKYDASESIWKQPLLYGGASCLLGGVLSDRLIRATRRKWLGRAAFPVTGLITASAAIFAARGVADPNTAIMLMCVAGAAYDFGQGANWATIVDVGGRYAGTAAGFVNLVGNMGNAVQPAIGAWVFNRAGWPTLFAVYAGVFLLAASMWLFIDPRQTFYDAEPSC
jgi:MFS transporter, ACS family, glucarate transporter